MSKIHEMYNLVLEKKIEKNQFLTYLDTADDINTPDDKNRSILFYAIEAEDYEVTEKLLAKGATVKAPDLLRSPLFFAVFTAYKPPKPKSKDQTDTAITSLDLIPLLLKAGANINDQTRNGFTLGHFATQKNDFIRTRLLLEYGLDPQIKDKSEQTMLMKVIGLEGDINSEILKLLFDHGAGITADFSLLQAVPPDFLKNVVLIGAIKNDTPLTSTSKGFENAIFTTKQFQEAVDKGESFNYIALYMNVNRLLSAGNKNAELIEFAKILKPLAQKAEKLDALKRMAARKVGFFEGKIAALSPDKIKSLSLEAQLLIREMQQKPIVGK